MSTNELGRKPQATQTREVSNVATIERQRAAWGKAMEELNRKTERVTVEQAEADMETLVRSWF